MSGIKINLFGEFKILVDGKEVLTELRQAKKTRAFLQYLILQTGRTVPHSELFEKLWPEDDNANPGTALRTLLYRFRVLLGQNQLDSLDSAIVTSRGAYRWNLDLDCEVDVFEFEQLCHQAENTNYTDNQRIEYYHKAHEYYTGDLLPDASLQSWVMPKSVYYHNMYLQSVFNLISLYRIRGDYDAIVAVCRDALNIDVLEERIHIELMQALVKIGKNREALSQYYYATDIQYKQLGVPPSDEIKALFKLIIRSDQEVEKDIEKIREGIQERKAEGAFVCEYEIFKNIYNLQERLLERSGDSIYLCLLTVTSTYSQPFDPMVLDNIMGILLKTIKNSLRRGDTISRYSSTQYVVMLPSVDDASGRIVMERVKKAFYKAYVKPSIMLTYRMRSLLDKNDNPRPWENEISEEVAHEAD